MPKKIIFESAVYRFLSAARHQMEMTSGEERPKWETFLSSLEFDFNREAGNSQLIVKWRYPKTGGHLISLEGVDFYHRGDTQESADQQREQNMVLASADPVQHKNEKFFNEQVLKIAGLAGLVIASPKGARGGVAWEEEFHDSWAKASTTETMDVRKMSEACTFPELRYIRSRLGDIRHKKLLEVGCGLGETAVYFALEGAEVTAVDFSQEMLEFSQRLAAKHHVSIKTKKTMAENINLVEKDTFDVIHCGNILHHADIDAVLKNMKCRLKPGGVFISWDPVAYNPIINVYRMIAKETRTPDEHPLTLRDIRLFKKYFKKVEVKWFWFFTLILFLAMFLVQRRDPNKERFWKQIIYEADQWKWLYKPLERLDRVVLAIFPFLGPLCWNVVIVASQPKDNS